MKQFPTVQWWNKIKNRLIISLSALLIFSLVLLGLICSLSFKSQVVQQISSKNIALSNNVKKKIDLFLSAITNDLTSLANKLGEEKNWSQQELLSRYLNKMPDVNRLTLLDNYGEKLLALSKQASTDPGREWKLQFSFQKNLLVSPVYPYYQAVTMIDVSVPIRNFADNKIKGIIKAGVSLRGLWAKISAIKTRPETTTVYLIDQKGNLIAHSDIGLVSGAIDFSHIKKVRQFIFRAKEKELKAPSIYIGNKNTTVIGVATRVDKINWGIVVEEPLDSAFSSYRHIKRVIFFSLAALGLLAALILVFFITRYTRSIDTLTRQAEALSEKEGSAPIEIDSKDEIAHLAKIFTCLQKQLWEKNENLKRRYKELEAIHDEFKESYDEFEQVNEKLEASQYELNKQKEFEKQLIETANVLIVVLNRAGELILSNRKCEEITGYNKNFILGKRWFQLMPPLKDRQKCLDHFQSSLQNKSPSSYEYPIVTNDGALRTISWHSTPMIDNQHNIVGIIKVGEDITEKKKLQQELETKNKALEEKNEELQNLVSIVSHDLKSPLYILQDFTNILLNDYKCEFGEDVTYYLERIKTNAQNMEKLIVDILEFSKIGTMSTDYQDYPINQIIQRVIDELKPNIEGANIRLSIDHEFPTIFCDPNRILQVFMNLVSNSIKFMGKAKDAFIEIGCHELVTEYEFFVKDNGIGIEKEYHEKIFKIFQRLKDLKQAEGNGVGLAIVKKIIENHGGRVWVDSEKGKGATFSFTIPKHN